MDGDERQTEVRRYAETPSNDGSDDSNACSDDEGEKLKVPAQSDESETEGLYEASPFEEQCSRCMITFDSEALYHIHAPCSHANESVDKISSTSAERPLLRCGKCTKAYKSLAELRRHFQTHCKRRFSCKSCTYAAHTLSDMKKHLGAHVVPRSEHKCHLCPQTFKQRAALAQHAEAHQGPTPNRCHWRKCGASFSSLTGLHSHTRWHRRYDLKRRQVAGQNCLRHGLRQNLTKERGKPRRSSVEKPETRQEVEVIHLSSDKVHTGPATSADAGAIIEPLTTSLAGVITISTKYLLPFQQLRQDRALRLTFTGKSSDHFSEMMELICKSNRAISVEFRALKEGDLVFRETDVELNVSPEDLPIKESKEDSCRLCGKTFTDDSCYIAHLPCFLTNAAPVERSNL